MPSLRSVSIRQKILLVNLATTATALLLASAAFILLGLTLARKASVHQAEFLLATFGSLSVPAIQDRNAQQASQTLARLQQHPEVLAACLYTLDGELLATYQHPNPPHPFTPPPADDYPWRFNNGNIELFRLVPPDGTAVGRIYLLFRPAYYHAWLGEYGGPIAGVILVPFGLAWLLSSRLRDILSRPILQLATVAERVRKQKDYSLRAQKEGNDELGTLVDAFNAMLGRIQERDLHLQQAHEQLELRVGERTRELQQQVTRGSLLNQITRAIAQRQDLDSILNVVLGQLESQLSIDFGCVHLFDPNSSTLNVAASRQKQTSPHQPPIPASSLSIHVNDSGFINDAHNNLRYAPNLALTSNPFFKTLAASGLASAVTLPLRVAHELFGSLTVARNRTDAFTHTDYDCLCAISEQVALAGHQAQLHAELRCAYDELRQTQHAVMQQERLRALGQMASGIAHDINNALSPVSGFAELLLLSEKSLSSNARKYLGHIQTAGDDVAHIVARLREFYRARPSDQPLTPINVNHLIQQVIDLTRPRWRDISQQKGVAILVESNLDPRNPEIAGAESELREALTNLVFNAIDAMPDGGTLTFRTHLGAWLKAPDPSQDSSHVVIEVVDTGTGMDDESRKRCLEPFFSTKGQRGTGLGLAMVYGVVQRHHGTIEIESALTKGSTFRLILPINTLPPTPQPLPNPATEPLPPLRILFVDDEPLVRELVRDILQNDGHHVTLADGGQSGLDAFFAAAWREQPFDAVITDLGMPHLDGRQLAQILKRESPRTPIIMMTGWGSLIKGEQDLRAPVDALLNKPPRIEEIQQALRRLTSCPSAHLAHS
jgi:signal transduction histidine kinase/CheY-like chemotaxis protein